MNKKYENSIHRLGRIGVIIGICFMLGIPAVISTAFHVWPENIGKLLTACVGLLAIYLPTNVAEVLGYTPMLGSSAYITFLTGNVTNLKMRPREQTKVIPLPISRLQFLLSLLR